MNIAFDRDQFRDIWRASKGVIFMGTPHRGSTSAGLGKTLGNIANAAILATGSYFFNRGVKTALLNNLAQESTELIRIADDFTQRASALRIITFYETIITPPMSSVVSLVILSSYILFSISFAVPYHLYSRATSYHKLMLGVGRWTILRSHRGST